MQQIILIAHLMIAIAMIALILLQHGKGADMGASFGSGSANSLFGSQGSLPFLVKLTASLAALFFITSLVLGYMGKRHQVVQRSVVDKILMAKDQQPAQQDTSSQ